MDAAYHRDVVAMYLRPRLGPARIPAREGVVAVPRNGPPPPGPKPEPSPPPPSSGFTPGPPGPLPAREPEPSRPGLGLLWLLLFGLGGDHRP
jgi:hypothetical protein